MSQLNRFLQAQEAASSGFATAVAELQAGRKQSHWIWYIFPQLAGLGQSATARQYGIRDVAEATEYLRHPVLRERLIAVTLAVAQHVDRDEPADLATLMGSAIDARKLVSSMTLFREVAHPLAADGSEPDCALLASLADSILDRAADQGLAECSFTLERLAGSAT